MKFKDINHKKSYEKFMKRGNISEEDPYRKAGMYLLALNEQTRKNVDLIYNFQEEGFILEGLNEAFQTSTSIRITRLALNLFNGYADENHPSQWSPEDLLYPFEYDLNYIIEAIKIRFEWI